MKTFYWTKAFLFGSVPEQYKTRLKNDYEDWKQQQTSSDYESCLDTFSNWMMDKPRPYLHAVFPVFNALTEIYFAELKVKGWMATGRGEDIA